MALLDGVKKILKMCGHAFTITVHDRLDIMEQRQAEMEQRQAETDNVLLRSSIRLAEEVRRGGRYEVLASDDPRNSRPALALLRYLYSMFPSPSARVSGCQLEESDWSAALSATGYAVESVPGGSDDLAILRVCGDAELPECGNLRPRVVVADLEAAADDRVKAMRILGYHWYIALEQPAEAGMAGRFYANYPVVLPDWRGHTIYFRDYGTFLHALHWCEAVLRQLYFGPIEE